MRGPEWAGWGQGWSHPYGDLGWGGDLTSEGRSPEDTRGPGPRVEGDGLLQKSSEFSVCSQMCTEAGALRPREQEMQHGVCGPQRGGLVGCRLARIPSELGAMRRSCPEEERGLS